MNRALVVVLAAGGIYALTAIKKGVGASKLEFYPDSVDFSDVTLTNWTFRVRIEVVNPTKTKQNINAIFGTVYAGSRKVARIQQTVPIEISKQASSFIEIPVKLTSDGAGYLLAKIIQGDLPSLMVQGTVDTMGVQIPFEQALT